MVADTGRRIVAGELVSPDLYLGLGKYVNDGDTLRCQDGRRVRLHAIAARETVGSCSPGHPCPSASASASKAALVGATRSASKELAPRGIRVNAVSPGFIDTDMTRGMPEAAHAKRVASIAMGRAGTTQEVAELVSFLLGDASSYVTGQVIGIDGQMVV